jgi:hypothetical protein
LQLKDPNIQRISGGTIQTQLGFGITLNKNSSIQREWIVISDPSIPLDFIGVTGVTTRFEQETEYSSSRYIFFADYTLVSREALVAFEVRFLTFDIWGRHERTLSGTEIIDLAVNATHRCESKWDLYSEHEASEYYASIAYVAQVRTAKGRVMYANNNRVLEVAREFSEKFSESDLEPTPVRR